MPVVAATDGLKVARRIAGRLRAAGIGSVIQQRLHSEIPYQVWVATDDDAAAQLVLAAMFKRRRKKR